MDRAIALAKGFAGVGKVANDMRLSHGKSDSSHVFADNLVTARVRSALLADRDINSAAIAVTPHKGEVRLSGHVDSQAQLLRAIDIARGVEGAHSVASDASVMHQPQALQAARID